MSKVLPKQHEYHLSTAKQEERRLINKKRRKKLKRLNRKFKKTNGH